MILLDDFVLLQYNQIEIERRSRFANQTERESQLAIGASSPVARTFHR